MPRHRQIPAYVHHKATGQARVRINGKDYYLGKYGSPESHDRYDELIAEQVIAAGTDRPPTRTLTAVLAAWWPECKRRYHQGKGKLGGAQNWRPIIRMLRTEHGTEPADRLGPAKLRQLIEAEGKRRGWSLRHSRDVLSKVKLIYRWAKNEELISSQAYEQIRDVEIRHGRRTKPLPPIDDATVDATLPHLKPVVAAMVRFQRLTGCRPGELAQMRPEDIDRNGDVWTYTPTSHKTEHHGKSRTIYIGPQAQQILAPWLLKAKRYVFPSRGGRAYSSDSYRRAVHRACDRAFPAPTPLARLENETPTEWNLEHPRQRWLDGEGNYGRAHIPPRNRAELFKPSACKGTAGWKGRERNNSVPS
jgi:integrase